VTKGEAGDEDYVRLGKRLVNLMYEPLDRLVKVLKVNYGQYWLDDVVKWDRRSGSLGHHCSTWQMSWSVDGANWTPFRPTTQEVFLTSTVWGPSTDRPGETGLKPTRPAAPCGRSRSPARSQAGEFLQ